jgi:hypothetical protein
MFNDINLMLLSGQLNSIVATVNNTLEQTFKEAGTRAKGVKLAVMVKNINEFIDRNFWALGSIDKRFFEAHEFFHFTYLPHEGYAVIRPSVPWIKMCRILNAESNSYNFKLEIHNE